MITNYYTLVHIAAELEHEFIGRTIDELFTQYRSELVISCKEIPSVIIAGCEPANNFICERKTFARARRNSTDCFLGVPGTVIENIFMHPTDRQMHMRLSDMRELVIQLFGSKANVLLLNAAREISETFLKRSDVKLTENDVLQTNDRARAAQSFSSLDVHQPLTTALRACISAIRPGASQRAVHADWLRRGTIGPGDATPGYKSAARHGYDHERRAPCSAVSPHLF